MFWEGINVDRYAVDQRISYAAVHGNWVGTQDELVRYDFPDAVALEHVTHLVIEKNALGGVHTHSVDPASDTRDAAVDLADVRTPAAHAAAAMGEARRS